MSNPELIVKMMAMDKKIIQLESQITLLLDAMEGLEKDRIGADKERCKHGVHGTDCHECHVSVASKKTLEDARLESYLAGLNDRTGGVFKQEVEKAYNKGIYDARNEIEEQLMNMPFYFTPNSGAGRLHKDIMRELFGK